MMRGLLRDRRIARLLSGLLGRGKRRTQPRPNARDAVIHVIILDGTMSSLKPGYETNAGQAYKLLRRVGSPVSIYYEQGIQWAEWRKLGDVLLGRGINRQIRRAYGYLASRYRPGDRIFLLGFSRGAYAVRSLAGVIDQVGLLKADHATQRNVRAIYRHYQETPDSQAARAFSQRHCHDRIEIEMIGVWDTVKSLGVNLPVLWRYSQPKHAFHNHHLGPSIKHGYHALARNETRKAYSPVMWTSDPGWPGVCEQMWFRGAHGDIGGMLDGHEAARGLSNIPFVWIMEKAESCGLPLPECWQASFPTDPSAPSLGTFRGWGRLLLGRRARQVGLDASERVHPTVQLAPIAQGWLWSSDVEQSHRDALTPAPRKATHTASG